MHRYQYIIKADLEV